MNRDTARTRLQLFCPVAEEPVLVDPDEIDVLLDMGKVLDVDARLPTEANWVETYDANYIIAHAWLAKAGRTADRYLFMSGGKMFSRQQFHDHCMTLYKRYMAKSPIKALRLTPSPDTLLSIPLNNWNANRD